MPKQPRWTVTADGKRPLAALVADLGKHGFVVREVLGEIGCVIGDATPAAVRRLRKLDGVADIAPDAPIDLGDPDRVTW